MGFARVEKHSKGELRHVRAQAHTLTKFFRFPKKFWKKFSKENFRVPEGNPTTQMTTNEAHHHPTGTAR